MTNFTMQQNILQYAINKYILYIRQYINLKRKKNTRKKEHYNTCDKNDLKYVII